LIILQSPPEIQFHVLFILAFLGLPVRLNIIKVNWRYLSNDYLIEGG
jgi:hypothetical protein